MKGFFVIGYCYCSYEAYLGLIAAGFHFKVVDGPLEMASYKLRQQRHAKAQLSLRQVPETVLRQQGKQRLNGKITSSR